TFSYATLSVTAQIPNYTGINVNQYVFAGRTGGANENCWIDDVCIQPWTPGAPIISGQPADATVARECLDTATFRVAFAGTPPFDVQWFSNDVPVATISASIATIQTYTTPPLNRTAHGARYHATIRNECGTATTRDAVVTVVQDDPIPRSAVANCLDLTQV